MFENCIKRKNTVKKEFQGLGLSVETLLAGIMNWIINQMPSEESVKIRFRTTSHIQQVNIFYHERHLRAKGLEEIAINEAEFILYEWEEKTSYANLSTEKICQSIRNAEVKNYYRHYQATNCDEIIKDFPQGDFEITKEDMELIDEFLNA